MREAASTLSGHEEFSEGAGGVTDLTVGESSTDGDAAGGLPDYCSLFTESCGSWDYYVELQQARRQPVCLVETLGAFCYFLSFIKCLTLTFVCCRTINRPRYFKKYVNTVVFVVVVNVFWG